MRRKEPPAPTMSGRDRLAVTAGGEGSAMIFIECAWCDAELALETLVETSVDCPDCRVTVDLAPDSEPIALAA
jgi:hypothetical protein